jgi:hypothetical protein
VHAVGGSDMADTHKNIIIFSPDLRTLKPAKGLSLSTESPKVAKPR